MFEILNKYETLKSVQFKSHNTFKASDILKRKQFFCDKSIDTLIFVDCDGWQDNAVKAFGDIEVKVFTFEKSLVLNLSQIKQTKAVVYITGKKVEDRVRYDFLDLIEIMFRLRSPNGCEWDKAQTHESIRINLIEEAYELVEGIDCKSREMMLEETGDVLLQAIFHTHIALDNGEFDYHDMLFNLCNKLITRHTHIFGENHAEDEKSALNFWNEAKKKEKKYSSLSDAMNRVPQNLPSLMYAYKVQKYAHKGGFDFATSKDALKKVYEEIDEILSAKESEVNLEGGDLLFAVVNFLRLINIEPELVLKESTKKFMARFEKVEDFLTKDGKELTDFTLEEMDAVWDKVKKCK